MNDRRQQVERLKGQLQNGGDSLRLADSADSTRPTFSTGHSRWDAMLGGGFQRGTLTEWFSVSAGEGASLISLWVANLACQANSHLRRPPQAEQSQAEQPQANQPGTLVVVDPRQQFYPPAAAAWGIDLDRLILIRPAASDCYWALSQVLRSSAISAAWCYLDQVNDRWFRRFQLAVETSGCFAAFVRPWQAKGRPSWSDLQFTVRPSVSENPVTMAWQVELVRSRGSAQPGQIQLQADLQQGVLIDQ